MLHCDLLSDDLERTGNAVAVHSLNESERRVKYLGRDCRLPFPGYVWLGSTSFLGLPSDHNREIDAKPMIIFDVQVCADSDTRTRDLRQPWPNSYACETILIHPKAMAPGRTSRKGLERGPGDWTAVGVKGRYVIEALHQCLHYECPGYIDH